MTTKTHVNRKQRREKAGVPAVALAVELGIDPSILSRHEQWGVPLPKRISDADYDKALERLAVRVK